MQVCTVCVQCFQEGSTTQLRNMLIYNQIHSCAFGGLCLSKSLEYEAQNQKQTKYKEKNKAHDHKWD